MNYKLFKLLQEIAYVDTYEKDEKIREMYKEYLRKQDVQNNTKKQVQRKKDRSKYSCKGDVSSEVYWIYTE